MIIKDLLTNTDFDCEINDKVYEQQIVFVNKDYVKEAIITNSSLNIDGFISTYNNIYFRLKDGKKGTALINNSNGFNVVPTCAAVTQDNLAFYEHSINFITTNYTEKTQVFLEQLKNSRYFAAVKLGKTVYIYGYLFGLKVNNFTVDLQGNGGVVPITVSTPKGAEEFSQPYIFNSLDPEQDFYDLFANTQPAIIGEFSNDFNDDLFI